MIWRSIGRSMISRLVNPMGDRQIGSPHHDIIDDPIDRQTIDRQIIDSHV
jgi:hypothetical protein